MNTRAGTLSARVKSLDIRHAVEIGRNSAHQIVLSGSDRYRLLRDLYAELAALGEYCRESLREELRGVSIS